LGVLFDAIKEISFPDDPRRRGPALFERMIVIISNVWGNAWAADDKRSFSVSSLKPAIAIFNRHWRETKDWLEWHSVQSAADDYYNFIIQAVTAHGPQALEALGAEFEAQWDAEASRRYWHTSRKRKIALSLYAGGMERDWLVRRLTLIEAEISSFDDLTTVLEEYKDQAGAWLEAGETGRAEALIGKIFEASFGISYEKDNQFTLWVDWFSRACQASIGNAQQMPHFFGALAFVQQSNRGAYTGDAARNLVRLVGSEQPAAALKYIRWLFDQHVLKFTTAVEGVVLAGLSSRTPPLNIIIEIIKHLLVPFEKTGLSNVAEKLCSGMLASEAEAKSKLPSLLYSIETKAFPDCREAWFQGFRNALAKSKTDWQWLSDIVGVPEPKSDAATYPTIVMTDGRELVEEQVQEAVHDFPSFLEFSKSIEEVRRFKWENTLSLFVSELSLVELLQVRDIISSYNPDYGTLAIMARRFHELGDNKLAGDICEELMSNSSPNGWGRWYDGGSRLAAFECQIILSLPNIREKALKQFVDDFLSESRWAKETVWSLDEILPIFFEQIPMPEIWAEIEEHIHQLYDFKYAEEIPPSYDDEGISTTIDDILVGMLFFALNLPLGELRTEAHQAICSFVSQGCAVEEVHAHISNQLSSEEEDAILAGLSVLQSLIGQSHGHVDRHSDQIRDLTNSPSYSIRLAAQAIAGAVDLPVNEVDPSRQDLRASYNLILPEIEKSNERLSGLIGPRGSSLSDTRDPIELISPYNNDYKILADDSGIPFQNLVARGVQLMGELRPQESWNRESEDRLQSFLKGMDLELAYRRPKAHVSSMALSHMIMELYDAGAIDEQTLRLAGLNLTFNPGSVTNFAP